MEKTKAGMMMMMMSVQDICFYYSRHFSYTKTRIQSADIYEINDIQKVRKQAHIYTNTCDHELPHREITIMKGLWARKYARQEKR